MQLKNNLYTISHQEMDNQNGCFTIQLNGEHSIYQAHFPGEPITPGVCIMQIGKELLEVLLTQSTTNADSSKPSSTSIKCDIKAIKNLKFLSVISPKEVDSVTYIFKDVAWAKDKQEAKAKIVVTSANEVKAKLSFTCHTHV